MGKFYLAFFLLCLFPISSFAQQPWANKLFGGVVTHDFGPVQRGAELKHQFKLTNIYQVPLEITRLDPSCDCLTVQATTRRLQPKETAIITLIMQTKGFSGPGTSSVRLEVSGGPKFQSATKLSVSANSRSEVTLTPAAIDFGNLQRGQNAVKHIDIEYTGTARIKEIVPNNSLPCELKTIALPTTGAKGFRLVATFKPSTPVGAFSHEVFLKLDDQAKTVLTFKVTGNVQGKLTASVNPLVFASAKVGEAESKKIILRGVQPFRIVGVDGLDDGITVDMPKDAAATQLLTVNLRPTKSGEIHRKLTIRTDLDNESIELVVDASVAK